MGLNTMENSKPDLLLHICCAPCSTYPIQLLKSDYSVHGFFYNPNLFPRSEFDLRVSECQRYCETQQVPLIVSEHDTETWYRMTDAYQDQAEGMERCRICFQMRLERTAIEAQRRHFSIFTTTLTIGTNKPARILFPLGKRVAEKYQIRFLEIDFKKKNGYLLSCQMSREFGMYRQDYCGCEYSLRDRMKKMHASNNPNTR